MPPDLLKTLEMVVDCFKAGQYFGLDTDFFKLLDVYADHLDQTTMLLLLDHHRELAYPTQKNWLQALQHMMSYFFSNVTRRSFVRQMAIHKLSECIASCRAYQNDEIIVHGLLKYLKHVYLDPDIEVQVKGLQLLLATARQTRTESFHSIIDVIETIIMEGTDDRLCCMGMEGIASLLSSTFVRLPYDRPQRLFKFIVNAVREHPTPRVRHTAVAAIGNLYANSKYQLQWVERKFEVPKNVEASTRGDSKGNEGIEGNKGNKGNKGHRHLPQPLLLLPHTPPPCPLSPLGHWSSPP